MTSVVEKLPFHEVRAILYNVHSKIILSSIFVVNVLLQSKTYGHYSFNFGIMRLVSVKTMEGKFYRADIFKLVIVYMNVRHWSGEILHLLQ